MSQGIVHKDAIGEVIHGVDTCTLNSSQQTLVTAVLDGSNNVKLITWLAHPGSTGSTSHTLTRAETVVIQGEFQHLSIDCMNSIGVGKIFVAAVEAPHKLVIYAFDCGLDGHLEHAGNSGTLFDKYQLDNPVVVMLGDDHLFVCARDTTSRLRAFVVSVSDDLFTGTSPFKIDARFPDGATDGPICKTPPQSCRGIEGLHHCGRAAARWTSLDDLLPRSFGWDQEVEFGYRHGGAGERNYGARPHPCPQ